MQNVVGRRTKQKIPQFVCLDCRSFFNPSGYKEDPAAHKADFEYLSANNEHHSSIQRQLCRELMERVPGKKTVLEIGHGNGWFLESCRAFGLDVTGFEINPYCHRFATEKLRLNSILGSFDDSHEQSYDIIVSIQVFEHLVQPRDLFKTMISKLIPNGAIYLSVPFIHRWQWQYLWSADSMPAEAPPDIFYDCDVHITHFSVEGMKQMGINMGAHSADYFVSRTGDAPSSAGAYDGVLFQF